MTSNASQNQGTAFIILIERRSQSSSSSSSIICIARGRRSIETRIDTTVNYTTTLPSTKQIEKLKTLYYYLKLQQSNYYYYFVFLLQFFIIIIYILLFLCFNNVVSWRILLYYYKYKVDLSLFERELMILLSIKLHAVYCRLTSITLIIGITRTSN